MVLNTNLEHMENKKNDPAISINVLEEKAKVEKEFVEKAKVRISKKVSEEAETVTTPVTSEEVKVEKIPVNKLIETAPQARYEGNTMIIPVVKEVAVVEKKLLLVEEIHITKYTVQIQDQQTISLRKEKVEVERIASPDNNKQFSK